MQDFFTFCIHNSFYEVNCRQLRDTYSWLLVNHILSQFGENIVWNWSWKYGAKNQKSLHIFVDEHWCEVKRLSCKFTIELQTSIFDVWYLKNKTFISMRKKAFKNWDQALQHVDKSQNWPRTPPPPPPVALMWSLRAVFKFNNAVRYRIITFNTFWFKQFELHFSKTR